MQNEETQTQPNTMKRIALALIAAVSLTSCANMTPETQAALTRIGEHAVTRAIDSKFGPPVPASGKHTVGVQP